MVAVVPRTLAGQEARIGILDHLGGIVDRMEVPVILRNGTDLFDHLGGKSLSIFSPFAFFATCACAAAERWSGVFRFPLIEAVFPSLELSPDLGRVFGHDLFELFANAFAFGSEPTAKSRNSEK